MVLIRTLSGFKKRTITKRPTRVPVMNLRIFTVCLCGMRFANSEVGTEDYEQGVTEAVYEEASRLHTYLEFVDPYGNTRISRRKNELE